jgi:hypothetical protein
MPLLLKKKRPSIPALVGAALVLSIWPADLGPCNRAEAGDIFRRWRAAVWLVAVRDGAS